MTAPRDPTEAPRLSEKEKESDREWARKVLARLSRPSDERVPHE